MTSSLRALPIAVLALSLAAGASARRPAPQGDRVELEVAGLLPLGERAAVLVLREKGSRTILPLVVPGSGLGQGENELRGPGLLAEAIQALGGRVAEVEIDRTEESRSGARVRVAQGGRVVELRGPPSESVALAISAKAPIVTSRQVLERDGLTPEDLAKAHARARAREERL